MRHRWKCFSLTINIFISDHYRVYFHNVLESNLDPNFLSQLKHETKDNDSKFYKNCIMEESGCTILTRQRNQDKLKHLIIFISD